MKVLIEKNYLHNTFAGVKVISRIIEEQATGVYLGHLTRRLDITKLKKAGVPYTGKETLEECIGVIYEWQIIKKTK
jgi:hypothetical protein